MPLDEDTEHATYSADHVTTYFTAATQAALVLTAFRAPFRGRSTPVNAWWGTFDLAAQFFSGRAADPASDDFITRNGDDAEQIEIGWWPGNEKHDGAAFFAFAYPAPGGVGERELEPGRGSLGRGAGGVRSRLERHPRCPDPPGLALEFARSAFTHSCEVRAWDPVLAQSAEGIPPPVN